MEQERDEPEWGHTVAVLREGPGDRAYPPWLANADLLDQAEHRWSGKVVPRIQMDGLLFTRPGDPWPFSRLVRVNFDENYNAWTFELVVSDFLRTADRAFAETVPAVLDAFLMQLAVDDEPRGQRELNA
jgi:hypothetical protein